jgi:zinc transport system substrate-binding protein
MYKTLLLAVNVLLFFVGCSSPQKSSTCDVLVSIPPYLYFVEALTEGQLKAVSIVPDQANPHLYEPSPKQVAEARRAKLWVRLSEQFETKIADALKKQNPSLVTINLAEGLSLAGLIEQGHSCCSCGHHHADEIDMHFWLSLKLAKEQASLIAKAICEAFPDRKEQVERTLPILHKKIEDLDAVITEKLLPYAGSAILVSHPAFAYFCRDYGLSQISIEHEGKDPLPQQINAILESANQVKIRVVFTQIQYNNKGAEKIADLLHLKVHSIDPYSANYLSNMTYIADCIETP